jgi:predicted DNA-binding transcriptional regulator AlpA
MEITLMPGNKLTRAERRRRLERRQQMREERRHQIAEGPIRENWFYRKHPYGELFFGLAPSQLEKKIESGEVPMPVKLTDTGRASGWFGRQILTWQAERQAKTAQPA